MFILSSCSVVFAVRELRTLKCAAKVHKKKSYPANFFIKNLHYPAFFLGGAEICTIPKMLEAKYILSVKAVPNLRIFAANKLFFLRMTPCLYAVWGIQPYFRMFG